MIRIALSIVVCLAGLAGLAFAAGLADVDAVPHLNDKGREAYTKFLAGKSSRAFAVAENGQHGASAGRDNKNLAGYVAMYGCNKAARNICRLYAVNDDVVYPRYAAFDEQSKKLLAGLAKETFRFSNYGDEDRDFGVKSPEALRKEEYHADTPASLTGVPTIRTPTLAQRMTSATPPILVDVLEGDGHKTLPGAYWVRGVGIHGNSDAQRDNIEERFALVLAGLTKNDKAAPLVFFCLEVRCWLSYNASLRARELGYTNVSWYRGGLKSWDAAGLGMLDAVLHGQVR